MREIIQELYFSSLGLQACEIQKNSKYRKLVEQASDCEDKLMERLDKNEQDLLQKCLDIRVCAQGDLLIEYFIRGFRMGAKLVFEVFSDGDGCLHDRKKS